MSDRRYLCAILACCSVLALPAQALAQSTDPDGDGDDRPETPATYVVTVNHTYSLPGRLIGQTSHIDRTAGYCPPHYTGGGGSGGGGNDSESYYDSDGDGFTDTPGHGPGESNHRDESGPGDSSVLCTYFYKKGLIPKKIYLADGFYGRDHIHPATLYGYQYWAVPLTHKLQSGNHPHIERLMYGIIKGWAYQMAYKMGVVEKPNALGWFLTKTLEPICFVIGFFTGRINYQKLWAV